MLHSSSLVIIMTVICLKLSKGFLSSLCDLMKKSIKRLLFEKAVFSADFEAVLLKDFFGGVLDGTFIDVGANAPESSVTFQFLQKGWRGIAIDPIPANAEKLGLAGFEVWCGALSTKELSAVGTVNFYLAGGDTGRKSSIDKESIDPLLETTEVVVPVKTLVEIIESQNFDHIDLLSVDVEGSEMDVLSTLPQDFPVKLLLVEDWARDTELHRFLLGKGFIRIRRTGYNSWYVPKGSSFAVSAIGQLHLIAKLNWFAPIRKRRFDKKKAAANKLDG